MFFGNLPAVRVRVYSKSQNTERGASELGTARLALNTVNSGALIVHWKPACCERQSDSKSPNAERSASELGAARLALNTVVVYSYNYTTGS